jgi:hypothetical protein
MDIQQTAQELQKFADANGLHMDVNQALNSMDAGEFVEINQAMDNSDNRTIMQILQKYKAQMSESYKLFASNKINESADVKALNNLTVLELEEFYKANCSFALRENSHLTIAELKTLVFDTLSEDLTSQLNANQITNQNSSQQQSQVNPQTAIKMKQADLQRNASNTNFKVSVPSSQSGSTELANVVGVDIGPTPDKSLVVTKDPTKSNQVNVFGLNDIEPVQEDDEHEEVDNSEGAIMAPEPKRSIEQTSSPLTHENPSLGRLSQAIGDIESSEDTSGEESPQGNEGMHNADEILSQIIDFCSRMRGR